jgi:Tfp pilus assembly protein PilO
MTRTDANSWLLRRLLRRLGLPGMSAILLLLVAAGLMATLPPLEEDIARLRQELAKAAAQPASRAPLISPEESLSRELKAFEQGFPQAVDLPSQLEILFGLAEQQGLPVDRGEYVLVEKATGATRRFEVTFPVTGSYQQVRALIDAALRRLPAAALSDLALEREKIGDAKIKATLKFVLFVRKAAP